MKAAPGRVAGGPTPVVDELKMSVYVRGLRRIKAVDPEDPAGGDWGMLHEGWGGGESSTFNAGDVEALRASTRVSKYVRKVNVEGRVIRARI